MPINNGLPFDATIILSGFSWCITASAKDPFNLSRADKTISSKPFFFVTQEANKCAITSESVSDVNLKPFFIRINLSSSEFSIMPLCTIEKGPELCGCEFLRFGVPCVAQRVWAIPHLPVALDFASSFFNSLTLPVHLILFILDDLEIRDKPAESYPLYSNLNKPSIRSFCISVEETAPNIPHIIYYLL